MMLVRFKRFEMRAQRMAQRIIKKYFKYVLTLNVFCTGPNTHEQSDVKLINLLIINKFTQKFNFPCQHMHNAVIFNSYLKCY